MPYKHDRNPTSGTAGSGPLALARYNRCRRATSAGHHWLKAILILLASCLLAAPHAQAGTGCGGLPFNAWLMLAAPTGSDGNHGVTAFRNAISQYKPGSLLLLRGHMKQLKNPAALRRFTTSLKSVSPQPLIAIDQEGGKIQAITPSQGFFKIPAMATMGRQHPPQSTRKLAQMVGQQLRSLGIDWNLAPVADLAMPGNPVITGLNRGFSADPAIVSQHVTAFVHGLADAGVISTLKHFPGHGRTYTDSHRRKVHMPYTLEQLKQWDLIPFQATLHQVPSIMMGHLDFPKICGQEPASLSKCFINDILRGQMAYQGLVITDGFGMAAIEKYYSQEQAALKALTAGNDIVMATFEAAPAIVKAVCHKAQQEPAFAQTLQAAHQRYHKLQQDHRAYQKNPNLPAIDNQWLQQLNGGQGHDPSAH